MPRAALPLALAATLALAACGNAEPCPTPLEECSGQCVDVQTDRRFCGQCGHACSVSEVCAAGSCVLATRAPCSTRTGGGFVTFGFPNGTAGACAGEVVKLWVTRTTFLDDAVSYVGSTTLDRVPVLDVLAGTDCDAQWSWNVNDLTPAFVTSVASTGCDLCPSGIQANVHAVARWCPSRARILAVDRRTPP